MPASVEHSERADRGLRAAVRRHPLGGFWILAVLVSWSWWIPTAVTGRDVSHVPGLVGPAVAGVVVTAIVDGRDGLGDLGSRVVRWRVAPRWYAIALAPLAAAGLALVVAAATGRGLPGWGELAHFPGLPTTTWLATFLVVVVVNGYGEEIGWRGVAWPRLRQHHGLVRAAALLVGPWALWHLPLFWLPTGLGDLDPITVPGWLVGLAAGTLVLGWLSDRARSSVLVVALFHASLNMASATDGTAGLPAALASGAVIAAAVVLLRHHREDDA